MYERRLVYARLRGACALIEQSPAKVIASESENTITTADASRRGKSKRLPDNLLRKMRLFIANVLFIAGIGVPQILIGALAERSQWVSRNRGGFSFVVWIVSLAVMWGLAYYFGFRENPEFFGNQY